MIVQINHCQKRIIKVMIPMLSKLLRMCTSPPRVQEPAPKKTSHPEPTSQSSVNQHVESLSIDETNKLRAKLGFKPLDVGTSSSNTLKWSWVGYVAWQEYTVRENTN
ncbi:unnamed protein product [Diabrotica balteata]|uniref:Uncharacterized protein n=1 Tax=Diabrotica balteata TaxID=107213 RepID=A0A9N9TBF7_DIABA|nr:unnamed protein product [Diabrotica balteata]